MQINTELSLGCSSNFPQFNCSILLGFDNITVLPEIFESLVKLNVEQITVKVKKNPAQFTIQFPNNWEPVYFANLNAAIKDFLEKIDGLIEPINQIIDAYNGDMQLEVKCFNASTRTTKIDLEVSNKLKIINAKLHLI